MPHLRAETTPISGYTMSSPSAQALQIFYSLVCTIHLDPNKISERLYKKLSALAGIWMTRWINERFFLCQIVITRHWRQNIYTWHSENNMMLLYLYIYFMYESTPYIVGAKAMLVKTHYGKDESIILFKVFNGFCTTFYTF